MRFFVLSLGAFQISQNDGYVAAIRSQHEYSLQYGHGFRHPILRKRSDPHNGKRIGIAWLQPQNDRSLLSSTVRRIAHQQEVGRAQVSSRILRIQFRGALIVLKCSLRIARHQFQIAAAD